MTWSTGKIAGLGLSAVLTTAGTVASANIIAPKEIRLRPSVIYEQNLEGLWSNLKLNHKDGSFSQHILDIGNIVKAVKSGLGLPDKDIADIFRVSRQTIHTYRTQESSLLNLKEHTRERANEVYQIVGEINKIFDKSPGPAAKNIQINNVSLLNLLCEEEFDIEGIIHFSYLLQDKIQKDRQLMSVKRGSVSDRKKALHSLTKHT